jgi:hypothetical protein
LKLLPLLQLHPLLKPLLLLQLPQTLLLLLPSQLSNKLLQAEKSHRKVAFFCPKTESGAVLGLHELRNNRHGDFGWGFSTQVQADRAV